MSLAKEYRLKGISDSFDFWNEFKSFQAKINFSFISGKYEVKIASNIFELYQVFRLRYKVLVKEQAKKKRKYFKIDYDEIDFSCDHLIIRNIKKNKIIGTYRLNPNFERDQYYSENEFNLGKFKNIEGIKLELGRACIHKKYRDGRTLDLLWHGLANYCQIVKPDFLFGCASFFTEDFNKGMHLIDVLFEKEKISNKYNIISWTPVPSLFLTKKWKDDFYKKNCPPLLKMYLKAGAKVHGKFYHDSFFQCLDYLVILDMKDISKLFKKRYFKYLNLSN